MEHIFRIVRLLLLLFIVSQIQAQSQFKIKNSVFGSGGIETTNQDYSAIATFGQPFTGTAQSDVYSANSGYWNQVADFITGVFNQQIENLPKEFRLYQNYPNPFNPLTTIKYALPKASAIELSIFNLLGQKVALLSSASKPAGIYTITWDASSFASGVYFYRLEINSSIIKTRRLVVLK